MSATDAGLARAEEAEEYANRNYCASCQPEACQ